MQDFENPSADVPSVQPLFYGMWFTNFIVARGVNCMIFVWLGIVTTGAESVSRVGLAGARFLNVSTTGSNELVKVYAVTDSQGETRVAVVHQDLNATQPASYVACMPQVSNHCACAAGLVAVRASASAIAIAIAAVAAVVRVCPCSVTVVLPEGEVRQSAATLVQLLPGPDGISSNTGITLGGQTFDVRVGLRCVCMYGRGWGLAASGGVWRRV